MKRIFLLALGLSSFAFGQGPKVEHMRGALKLIQRPEVEKRAAGYRTFHMMGTEHLESYAKGLRAAREYHFKVMKSALKDKGVYGEHEDLRNELESARERTMKQVMIDFKKDKGEIDKVKKGVEDVDGLFKKVERMLGKDTAKQDARVLSAVDALAEIDWELDRVEAVSKRGWMDEDAPDLVELRDAVMDSDFDLDVWVKRRELLERSRGEVRGAAAVTKHNGESKWAKGAEKEFAAMLNRARVVMGVGALRLDEQLSDASEGHSADMARLNFFAHDSPVQGKTSPGDRAVLAKFKGGFRGENIAMGYPGPAGNYWGWFYSDGHRFNLFRDGPNTLGVGISGRHWTMMTGARDWGK